MLIWWMSDEKDPKKRGKGYFMNGRCISGWNNHQLTLISPINTINNCESLLFFKLNVDKTIIITHLYGKQSPTCK